MTNSLWQRQARNELERAGHDKSEALAIARLLLDHVQGTRQSALLLPDETIDSTAQERLHELLQAALRRRPLPHLLGQASFYGLEFEVSDATLIPRPETELLVETTLERLQGVEAPRIAIAVTLATQRRDAMVWGIDLSEAAREVATRNANRHGAKISFLPGSDDWFSPLENLPSFDALVSNPPYIATHEIEELQPEVRDYEPRLALDGGTDGLGPYRVFAAQGQRFLKPNGFFAMELGQGQWDDVRVLFEAHEWKVLSPHLDFQGIARVLVAVSGANPA
jgi:release factor glutamine methyltransferase